MDILILALLFVKHWVFDFILQTQDQIKYKGEYGNIIGMSHSIFHGLATFGVIALVLGFNFWVFAGTVAIIDAVLHYHIDWYIKNVDKGTPTVDNKKFWFWLGLDQLAHNMCYLFYTILVSVLVL